MSSMIFVLGLSWIIFRILSIDWYFVLIRIMEAPALVIWGIWFFDAGP